MESLIPSKYYLNYCKENGITFTDRELATMILNNYSLTLKEKLDKLEKMAAECSDAELKSVIDDRITRILDNLDTVCSSEIGCVFLVEDDMVFDEFEAARKYCKTLSKRTRYGIIKTRILSSRDDTSEYRSFLCGGAQLNADYEIVNIFDSNAVYPNELTDCFIPFRHPFERGDIVRSCRTGIIGVVETSQKEWSDILKRAENNKLYDFIDSVLAIEYPDDGDFSCEYIQPIYLEKLPLDKNGIPVGFDAKDKLKNDLIYCVSQLMRDRITLDAFIRVFLEWREEQIYKKIKPRSRRDADNA